MSTIVGVRRSEDDRSAVRELLGCGLFDLEVAAIIGVPAATVGHWRRS
jgi:hypothetical protein